MEGHIDDRYENGVWTLFKQNGELWFRGERKIPAIKAHREIWRSSLREAKFYIDGLEAGTVPDECVIRSTNERGNSVRITQREMMQKILDLESRVQALEMVRGLQR